MGNYRICELEIGGFVQDVLSGRQSSVLSALVNEYVASAVPVASKTICERYGLGVSSATVRAVLAALETQGYAMSPHTSAGRVPTDMGYRVFVDGLIADEDDLQESFESMQVHADEVEELFTKTCVALARITHCLAVLLSPKPSSSRVQRVALVFLDSESVMLVVVTEQGEVKSRRLTLGFPVTEEQVLHVEEAIAQIESMTQAEQDEYASCLVRAERRLLGMVMEQKRSLACNGAKAHVHRHGMSALISQPEFSDSRRYVPLTRMLEDDSILLYALLNTSAPRKLTVRIGRENEPGIMQSTSMVAKGYRCSGGEGVVAVIGPTRMDYASAICAVDSAANMLEVEL